MLETGIHIGAVSLVSAGLVLSLIALRHRTAEHPPMNQVASYHPRNWKPIWKMRPWFTPKGYRYHITGWTLFLGGIALRLVWDLVH